MAGRLEFDGEVATAENRLPSRSESNFKSSIFSDVMIRDKNLQSSNENIQTKYDNGDDDEEIQNLINSIKNDVSMSVTSNVTLENMTGGIGFTGSLVERKRSFLSDSGNIILDMHGMLISDPEKMEAELISVPGIVEVGIFAKNKPTSIKIGRDSYYESIDC